MSNDLKIGLQYCMPKHLLTRLVGKLAAAKAGFLTTAVIKWFIRQYKVEMGEAKNPDPKSYPTFNDFFVRELKEGARPVNDDANVITHPADACVSQAGPIEKGRLIQAKGHTFDACELLGGDAKLAEEFAGGDFATLYLSPRDYHRVHMPCDGTLRQMIYVPGDLFSVNPLTAENVPNLFARNERVVCIFETAFGPMAHILVGATIVGSIETVWSGTVTPPTGQSIRRWDYPTEGEQAIRLKKGQEMGRFKLGSTVINLFPKGAITFDEAIIPGKPTRMGDVYARQNGAPTPAETESNETQDTE
ncbi:phosphatidylserine decarboxylase [Grimontia hollisae]|uniref:Phosphatidylserine decarboxylase proenzyme n=2 Tax=Grimontia hollisae TaxID=673 RepID=D0I2P1_GRIHO|nr:archaetidylserine decarboxylase [Grimontia hollisae]AMG30858.1 phosphatidylserine decarboxylase [Grimontia hollisae]EEY74241.1 phosphatidylserine decarboxylase [Grimontia hollisae CIP 101886]MDF2183180.1 archaetidylserine decarboxylase [Grimontia hollisae]STO47247.1 Phosphatidylserine decarboxylase proenzyme [Grimontia hollisae]STO56030.1 Phosphatidylserine decarboxylase proenzyme [Grimontia hollisae]